MPVSRSAVADRALLNLPLVLLSCMAAKSEKWEFFDRGCKGKVDFEEVESKWLKGFPCISVQGSIIISKVKI